MHDTSFTWGELLKWEAHYRTGVHIFLKERHKRSCGQISVIFGNWYMVKEYMMAKSKKEAGKAYEKPKFKGYINAEIPSERKHDVKVWIREQEVVALEIDELASSLYRISFGVMQGTNSYQASATCNDPDSPNAGYVLSAQASNWYDAIAVLCWKHRELLQTDWTQQLSPGDDDDIS